MSKFILDYKQYLKKMLIKSYGLILGVMIAMELFFIYMINKDPLPGTPTASVGQMLVVPIVLAIVTIIILIAGVFSTINSFKKFKKSVEVYLKTEDDRQAFDEEMYGAFTEEYTNKKNQLYIRVTTNWILIQRHRERSMIYIPDMTLFDGIKAMGVRQAFGRAKNYYMYFETNRVSDGIMIASHSKKELQDIILCLSKALSKDFEQNEDGSFRRTAYLEG